MPPFNEIDHTADIGLDIQSDTFPALLRDAAEGMRGLCFNPGFGPATEYTQVEVQESEPDELLQTWLSELNYQSLTRPGIDCEICLPIIEREENGNWRLRARIGWTDSDDFIAFLRTEIKAVTYHQLSVQKKGGGWTGRVIFDI